MKKMMMASMWAALLAIPCVAFADIQVSLEKKGEKDGGRNTNRNVQKSTEDVMYTIGVTNNSSADVGPLEVKYVIFVERQQAGKKRGTEVTQAIKGKSTVASVAARKKSEFDTEPVTLKTERLDPGFYYPDGGRQKAQDMVKGVWIRVFDGAKMVADFSNPTTIAKREKWEE
jgi:hypothetical protein